MSTTASTSSIIGSGGTDMFEDDQDLGLETLLPPELFDHPDFCSSRYYWRWEDEVAAPKLRELGYEVKRWWSTDSDSFGPLVRAVELVKDGVSQTYYYG